MAEKPPELRVARPTETTPLGEMAMARAWLQHLREARSSNSRISMRSRSAGGRRPPPTRWA